MTDDVERHQDGLNAMDEGRDAQLAAGVQETEDENAAQVGKELPNVQQEQGVRVCMQMKGGETVRKTLVTIFLPSRTSVFCRFFVPASFVGTFSRYMFMQWIRDQVQIVTAATVSVMNLYLEHDAQWSEGVVLSLKGIEKKLRILGTDSVVVNDSVLLVNLCPKTDDEKVAIQSILVHKGVVKDMSNMIMKRTATPNSAIEELFVEVNFVGHRL